MIADEVAAHTDQMFVLYQGRGDGKNDPWGGNEHAAPFRDDEDLLMNTEILQLKGVAGENVDGGSVSTTSRLQQIGKKARSFFLANNNDDESVFSARIDEIVTLPAVLFDDDERKCGVEFGEEIR